MFVIKFIKPAFGYMCVFMSAEDRAIYFCFRHHFTEVRLRGLPAIQVTFPQKSSPSCSTVYVILGITSPKCACGGSPP